MSTELKSERKGGPAVEILVLIVLVIAWIILQAWVLPRFGVKT
jgi:hypothetical protein